MQSEDKRQPSTPIILLDYKEAASILKVKPQTLGKMVCQKRITHIHVSRLVRFELQDLVAYLAAHKTEAVEPKGKQS